MCVTIRAIKEQAAVSKSQPVSQSPPNDHKSRGRNDGGLKWCFNLCYLCVSFFFLLFLDYSPLDATLTIRRHKILA